MKIAGRGLLIAIALGLTCGDTTVGGQSPTKTPDIHYVPTPQNAVEAMLDLAGVTDQDMVYDLGSGDGRIPITAARKHGAKGVGIEIDPDLVKRATDGARKAGVSDKVTFSQADLFKTDLSQATVVTLFLSPSVNLRLRSKLMRDLAPGSRIVAYRFPVPDWPPERTLKVGSYEIFLWKIPAGDK